MQHRIKVNCTSLGYEHSQKNIASFTKKYSLTTSDSGVELVDSNQFVACKTL